MSNESTNVLRRRTLARAMVCDAHLSDELAEQIWRNPHSLIVAGKKLQEKALGTVVYLERGSRPFTFKHRLEGDRVRTLRRSLRPTAGHKAFHCGKMLRDAGIATPQPRASWERCWGPLRLHSYFLCDYVEGTTLYRLLRFENPDQEKLKNIARQVATIRQRLNNLRVCHNDFKTENLLIDPAGKVWLLDLEMTRRCFTNERLRKRQAREIRDLLHARNYLRNPASVEYFREALLETDATQQLLRSRHGADLMLCSPQTLKNEPSQLVTVLVSCQNNADTISLCLESVRNMADEILVVDCGSTDQTISTARESDCHVLDHSSGNQAEILEAARQQAKHPWILQIHANERLGGDLSRDIQDLLISQPLEYGFAIKQAPCAFGQPAPSKLRINQTGVRLFRAKSGHFEMREGQAELILREGKIGFVTSRLFRDNSSEEYNNVGDRQTTNRQAA